jgi:hypothetical protein
MRWARQSVHQFVVVNPVSELEKIFFAPLVLVVLVSILVLGSLDYLKLG